MPPDPRLGVVLQERYQILERIASGAMGVVYRGERVGLGRTVAVKFLHPWIASQQTFRTRFETEARAMSRLSHPHCVSVIDFGVEGSSPYVVMDFVTGITLRQLLARGPIPPSRTVAIARQVLSGVAHAHSQQIIHRDLKPENLILSDTVGLGDQVRILDFGLAKLRDGPAMTTGLALGTPSYMSPEQTGASGEIDGRTDLYAIGVVLFEMLAGRKPFVSDKVAEVLLMHRDAPPPSLRRLVPALGISLELESAVNRALAKAPTDRFQTARDFSQALERTPEAAAGFSAAAIEDARAASGEGPPGIGAEAEPTRAAVDGADATIAQSRPGHLAAERAPSEAEPSPAPMPGAPLGAGAGRMWLGFVGFVCLALVLVAVGLRGSPGPTSASTSTSTPTYPSAPTSAPAAAGTRPPSSVPEAPPRDPGPSPLTATTTSAGPPAAPASSASSIASQPTSKPDPTAVHSAALPEAASKEGTPSRPGTSAGQERPAAADPAAATLARRLQTADDDARGGDWRGAMTVLEKARREAPRDASIPYRIANLGLEHQRWRDGADAARAAGARDPKYRSDDRLNRNLIRALGTDPGYEQSEPVLRAFGPAAIPLLEDAATHDANPRIRQRARDILQSEKATRFARPRGTNVSSRPSPAAAKASRPLFSR